MLIEVNLTGEETKQGFGREELLAGWEQIVAVKNLQVAGLMTMAAYSSDPEAARPTFAALRALRDELARFINAGRRTGGRKLRVATGQSTAGTTDRERSRAIRAWAGENGYEVSERGRLSSEIVTAYDEAQRQAAEPVPAPARKRAPRRKVAAAKK